MTPHSVYFKKFISSGCQGLSGSNINIIRSIACRVSFHMFSTSTITNLGPKYVISHSEIVILQIAVVSAESATRFGMLRAAFSFFGLGLCVPLAGVMLLLLPALALLQLLTSFTLAMRATWTLTTAALPFALSFWIARLHRVCIVANFLSVNYKNKFNSSEELWRVVVWCLRCRWRAWWWRCCCWPIPSPPNCKCPFPRSRCRKVLNLRSLNSLGTFTTRTATSRRGKNHHKP
jgi:hypothetical protein